MKRSALTLSLALAACAGGKSEVKPAAPVAPAPAPVVVKPPPEPTPAELHATAKERLAAHDLDGAAAALQKVLAKQPNDVDALFEAAWVAEQRGQLDPAAGLYKRALEAQPDHLGAALNLARIDRLKDRYADGEAVLNAALQKRQASGGEPKLLNALAALQRLDKKTDDAEATIRRVLERHPRDADAYKNLALLEIDRGRVRLAEIALANARKLDDKDPGIANNLGVLSLQKGELTAARARFLEATQLDAQFAPAWANLGALALQYRDYGSAAEAYDKATTIDGARWELQLARAWALEGLKKPKDAQAGFEKVLALKPGQDDALFGRAVALRAQNDLPAAMKAFQEYAAAPGKRLKEAQAQIALIDVRLKNPPATKPAEAVAKKDARPAAPADMAELKLPAASQEDGLTPPALPNPDPLPLPDDPGLQATPPAPVQPAQPPAASLQK